MSNEESIFNLIPPVKTQQVKSPMYRSKYPGDAPPTASTFGASIASQTLLTNIAGDFQAPATVHPAKQMSATFGPSEKTKLNPHTFTKSHEKEPRLPEPSKFTYTDENARKPKVPAREEKPVFGLVTTKNFVTANAIENILMEKKTPADKNVDWLKKEEYGKVPAYLDQVKTQVHQEYETIRKAQEQDSKAHGSSKMRLLSEDERLDLLNSLKKKWERVNHEYQSMTHIVTLDTIGKVRRKEQFESTLAQLEKDIARVDKKFVYVVDDA